MAPTVPSLALSIPTMHWTGSTITCPSHPRLSRTSYVMTSPNSSLGGADTASTLLLGEQRPGRVPDQLASSPNIPLLWRSLSPSAICPGGGHLHSTRQPVAFSHLPHPRGSVLALSWVFVRCSPPHCGQDTHLGQISLIQVYLPCSLTSIIGTQPQAQASVCWWVRQLLAEGSCPPSRLS